MKRACKEILIFGMIILFSSCKGQVEKKSRPGQESIGVSVAKLDSKAALIFNDRKNNYWFGSSEIGIYKYDGKGFTLYTMEDGLVSHNIIDVQEDKYGNVYFDTPEGVISYDGIKFKVLEIIDRASADNKWKLNKDDLWFRMGWDKKGPLRFDGQKLYYLKFPKCKMEDEFYSKYPNVSYSPYGIYAVYKDRSGNIWFGTADMGIFRYDGQKIGWMYEQQLTETPNGGAFGIRSIAEDKNGFFWFCNADFKYKILYDSLENNDLVPINYERMMGLKSDNPQYFLSMVTDHNGDIWMLNRDGVWKNDGKKLNKFSIKNGQKSVELTSIFIDNQGAIWVGTQNSGVHKFNGKTFEKFKLSE